MNADIEISPYIQKTFKERARIAAKFHTGMALRFRKLGNEADALRADHFAAYWNKKWAQAK